MSEILKEVLSANSAYSEAFGEKGKLALPPARRFAVLTCMDARLDPAKFAGLREGDAHVIRNAGGRASQDAIRSLVISYKLLGTKEWFVIHHTDCGMELFNGEIISGLLEKSLETATVTEAGWVDVGPGPGDRLAGIQGCPRRRRRRCAHHPGTSTRPEAHPDLRLHLQCQNRPTRGGAGGDSDRRCLKSGHLSRSRSLRLGKSPVGANNGKTPIPH
jgi:hypothetical protein